ncbi:hypothetical protein CS912_01925 (plasmid) [Klebsiella variicola]|nr:hypothetical protein A225_NDM1p0165 [Klebsiella michiganensis E718]ATO02634.1 hypothetical protein AN676_0328455 [Klebsiella pneumoniae subsp. pneumoniae]AUS91664.1 hypothetical protein [Klebsiella pneumoniae]AUS91776.1 hypothetical protein [Serratia marcescens]AUS92252.1 hypothetical protein [Klebsiella michiganensis]AUS92363.1 hypothetical protein [Enterobacter cloacae]PHH11323.1 hypothetical protein CRX48_00560 [Morganella morganii]PHZ96742.1 hypothetical protein CS911_02130 [Klebsiell
MLKRHYEEYHLIDSSELYFHSSSSGTQIIKRPILDNINNIIFSVESKWVKDSIFHLEGIFAVKNVTLDGWGG